jgi:hypothetical protein
VQKTLGLNIVRVQNHMHTQQPKQTNKHTHTHTHHYKHIKICIYDKIGTQLTN